MEDFRFVFAVVAAVVSFIAHPLYIRAILRKDEERTVPHLFTWLLSAVLAGVELFFFEAAGGRWTMFVLAGDFVGFIVITGFSFRYGKNGHFDFGDWTCLLGALVSVSVYVVFHNALWAFVMAIFADVLALIPTIRKTYESPESEDFVAWSFTCAGNALNFLALSADVEWIYVLTIFIIDQIVWILIFRGRKNK